MTRVGKNGRAGWRKLNRWQGFRRAENESEAARHSSLSLARARMPDCMVSVMGAVRGGGGCVVGAERKGGGSALDRTEMRKGRKDGPGYSLIFFRNLFVRKEIDLIGI